MKKLILLTLIGFTFSFLVACGGGSGEVDADGGPSAPDVIKFGVQPSLQPVHIAYTNGMFDDIEEKYGTTFELIQFDAGGPQNTALAANEISWAQYGMAPSVVGMASADALLVAINILEQTAIISDKSIESVADLEGKNVGFPGKGSQQYPLILKALEEAGLEESDINLLQMNAANMYTALEQGELEAYIAWDPHTTRALYSDAGKVLTRAEEIMPLKDGHYLGEGVVVKSSFANDYPELTKDIIEVLKATNDYIVDNLTETPAIWSEAIGLDEDIINFSLDNSMSIYIKDISPDMEDLVPYVHMLNEFEITQIDDVESFLEERIYSTE
ncbi:ABC transporter substrate-binding protein [Evansella sp. AB-P1]|uniref:ABC transporter substrate-binding protein n=1 Tax=Evansella sp. AB-P1 TaxID=3037653 RepID=UPI00241CBE80|nr:ABC transporter substrate-binding protein [Evansella sp. AB-P1]MDG5789386.1 ABC transporter substrate-binding protein [Evansella sp. AB-P1]